jgi:hypothetical protein
MFKVLTLPADRLRRCHLERWFVRSTAGGYTSQRNRRGQRKVWHQLGVLCVDERGGEDERGGVAGDGWGDGFIVGVRGWMGVVKRTRRRRR